MPPFPPITSQMGEGDLALFDDDSEALGEADCLSDIESGAFQFGEAKIDFVDACASQIGTLELGVEQRCLIENGIA